MSQQLITEHCSVFDEDNQKFCRYTPAKENEPNRNSKFNGSTNPPTFGVAVLILLSSLTLFVRPSSLKAI